MRTAPFFCLAVAACGGKVETTPPVQLEGADRRAGFVICGDAGACDVGSGNQCYRCDSSQDWTCHSLDLPARCADESTISRRLCDGAEECPTTKSCTADAYANWLCR